MNPPKRRARLTSGSNENLDFSGRPRGDAKKKNKSTSKPRHLRYSVNSSVSTITITKDLTSVYEIAEYFPPGTKKPYNLDGANFNERSALGIEFTQKTINSLARATFKNSKLAGATFKGLSLFETNFNRADLSGATFMHTNLRGSTFINANLSGSTFTKVDLSGAKFGQADLSRATLEGVNLRGLNLQKSNLEEVRIVDCQMDHRTLWPEGFSPST